MKRTISIIIALCMGLAILASGCSKGPAKASSSVNFTFVSPLIAHPVWLGAKEGIEAAAKDFPGLKVTWSGPTTLDAVKQNEATALAVAQKADGIGTFCLSESAQSGEFQKVLDAKVLMFTGGGDGPNIHKNLSGGCNPDPTNWGYSAGKEVVKALGGKKIYVAEILYALDSELALGIMKGYEKAFAENAGGFEVVAVVADNSDSAVAADKTGQILSTYPKTNAIVCCGGEAAGAAAGVLKERKIDPKNVVIFGDGSQEDCIAAILDGYVLGSVAQNYFQYGYRPAMWTYMFKAYGAKPAGASPFIDSGVTLINKDNCKTFNANFKDGKQWFTVDFPTFDWAVVTKK